VKFNRLIQGPRDDPKRPSKMEEGWRRHIERAKQEVELWNREQEMSAVVWTAEEVAELARIARAIDEQ
jgi:hypothetical protein